MSEKAEKLLFLLTVLTVFIVFISPIRDISTYTIILSCISFTFLSVIFGRGIHILYANKNKKKYKGCCKYKLRNDKGFFIFIMLIFSLYYSAYMLDAIRQFIFSSFFFLLFIISILYFVANKIVNSEKLYKPT